MILPEFDRLHVISDLHLGGSPNPDPSEKTRRVGQIFRERARLAWLGGALVAPGRRVALVLAGDVVDTLAHSQGPEDYAQLADPGKMVATIAANFAEVFASWGAFAETPGHRVYVLIGNHDIELAFPEAQLAFRRACTADEDAQARIVFVPGGTGLRCKVGAREVYVTHGNEADEWNQVDHEDLRRRIHARSLGATLNQPFNPNPGTLLVCDAMNDIKGRHPFVDLFKPEEAGVVKMLGALFPSEARNVLNLAAAAKAKGEAKNRPLYVLGAGPDQPATTRSAYDLLTAALAPSALSAAELKKSVESHLDAGTDPTALVEGEVGTLGSGQVWLSHFGIGDKTLAVTGALRDWLRGDRSFFLNGPDSGWDRIRPYVAEGTAVVIAGHTHLPRWLPGDTKRPTYLNAGTWARTIGLSDAMLQVPGERGMGSVVEAFESRELTKLDDCRITLPNGRVKPLVADLYFCATVDEHEPRLEQIVVEGNSYARAPVDLGQPDLLQ